MSGPDNDRVSASLSHSASPMDARQWWINAWRPSTTETTYEISDIEGEVPRQLHGTLYRNGPSQKILPAQGHGALHLFDGDGLVHAFRIDDGRVFYAGRFVEHPTFVREQNEARYCMNGVGVPADDPVDGPRVQPNTNVVFHGGKLMALVENGYPFELEPYSLAPMGTHDFGGSMLGMSVSAHPQVDVRNGQMMLHGYQPMPPYLQYYVLERDGTCSVAETVDAPHAVMAHTMAITENYAIFPWAPACIDGQRLLGGGCFGESLRWEPERGLRFGIRRREAGAATQWFTAPTAGYMFHHGNAYEDNGRIVMDACTYRDGQALLDSLAKWRSAAIEPGMCAVPFAYEFDLHSGTCSERQLGERGVEFPRIDDRLVGYENRYGYAVLNRAAAGSMEDIWSTIVRYDRRSGQEVVHDFGRWHWPGEPVFVPRSDAAAEDEGFILCVVYDGRTDGSYLAVLDAQNVDGPLLAKCHLEHRIPMGFHGNFVPDVV